MKPTKEEMLDKIYDKIADKTLSFGCIIKDIYADNIFTIVKYQGTTKDGYTYFPKSMYSVLEKEGYVYESISLPNLEDEPNGVWNCYGSLLKSHKKAREKNKDVMNIIYKLKRYMEVLNIKTIGHPVMIGDIANWLIKNPSTKINWFFILGDILNIYETFNKPIDEQPIECIKYVYDLLPKDTNE